MKIYLVGGAVRDGILGRNITDRDYLVVGSSVQEMLDLGYTKVGSNFPVFLHPKTQEEYALARKETKVAQGHTGFDFSWDGVTLQEDLCRRDLTINAMAQDLTTKKIIDYHGGLNDLRLKRLRHVSEHFVEDPLRVLRVGRFLAQLDGFEVADETLDLCIQMGKTRELTTLTGERILGELKKVFSSEHPWNFFKFIKKSKNLTKIFPELEEIIEKDILGTSTDEKLASFLLQIDYEGVRSLCERLRVSNKTKKLICVSNKLQMEVSIAEQLSPVELLKLLKQMDAFRQNSCFESLIAIVGAGNAEYLRGVRSKVLSLNIQEVTKGLDKSLVAAKVLEAQLKILA